MIRYTKQELNTVVKTEGKGRFNVNYKSIKTKHMKSKDNNYATKVIVGQSFFVATTKREVVDGLYYVLNSER